MLENTTTPDGKTVNSDGAWTVDGIVQSDVYNPEFPLKGMLKELHLELSDAGGFVESGLNLDTSVWAAYNDSAENLVRYAAVLSGETTVDELVNRVYPLFPEEGQRFRENYQVIKEFLNSFDWRNASDKTKVDMAARLVCVASYDRVTT